MFSFCISELDPLLQTEGGKEIHPQFYVKDSRRWRHEAVFHIKEVMGMDMMTNGTESNEMIDDYVPDSEVTLYVREALKSVSQGDNEYYNQLVEVVSLHDKRTADDEAMLVTTLRALSESVSCIDAVRHEGLLSSIFQLTIWNRGPDVMDAFVELMICLAAASGKFIDACLDVLVCNFLPPIFMLNFLKQPRGVIRKEQVLSRMHSALHDIAALVPLTPKRLESIISNRMPKITAPEAWISIYAENLLRLESGELGEFVGTLALKAVVDKLVDLDVEIILDPNEETSSKGIFDMELEDFEENEDGVEKVGHEVSRGNLNWQSLGTNDFADKLDNLMVLTCEHLKSCAITGRLNEVFETLMVSFESTVMLALKSKFTQFVLFYASSLDPENCGLKFANRMADLFLDKSAIIQIRMVAVSYLASYLARGRFLSAAFVAKTLQRLVDWCYEYCQFREGEMRPTTYRTFYACCQAIMYVLCFRMGSIMEIPHLKLQLFNMPLERILRHSWNPLQVCLPSIVEEFLRQAKAARLLMVSEKFIFSDLLDSNLSKAFGGQERLDMFFPFDPCLLKKTDRFIRPNFTFWSMVQTTYARVDRNEVPDEEEEEDDDDDEVTVEHIGNLEESSEEEADDHDMGDFESSLNKMSITPRKDILANGLPLTRMPARIQPSTSPW
ncbi:hypothetical protein H6P81_020764 [Aristolochia fimbriata]|uniref:RNA polymerase I-specific transcription initiation factor RRN3 n=1 Tax=Aristolochia fimbriata TaxID=158543 RepID=A0AAV7DVM6_ARIFI|nr:hypothetical protein H6P81_020764 [Aristolochia fimbriata]